MLRMIFACDKTTRCIGVDGKLPWRISEDLKFFKETTMNNFVVCGRKTYESLPKLEGRRFIVITHDPCFKGNDKNFVFATCASVEKFMTLYQFLNGDVFVIGGATIYEAFKDYVEEIYINEILTLGDEPYEGDTYVFDYHECFKKNKLVKVCTSYDKNKEDENKNRVSLEMFVWVRKVI